MDRIVFSAALASVDFCQNQILKSAEFHYCRNRLCATASNGSMSVVALNGRSPGLPVDRSQRRLKVDRSSDHDTVSAQFL
jgi:hypothetical protein